MGKIIYYVACSLDGYLADEKGGVDWLTPYQEAGFDYGYEAFYQKIGFIISGSKTFEQASNFPGGWAFPHATTYIFSSRQIDTLGREDLVLWNGGIRELSEQLKKKNEDTWLIGGANLAGQFVNEGMLDEVILSIMPTMLGRGVPIFEGVTKAFNLRVNHQESFPNGVVQLVYRF